MSLGQGFKRYKNFSLLIVGKRKAGKAKIKRRETERKTGGKGSQGKGKARSQKKAWPGKTGEASWKRKKRERESRKEGKRRKRTTGKERKERWGKKKTGRGKKVWLLTDIKTDYRKLYMYALPFCEQTEIILIFQVSREKKHIQTCELGAAVTSGLWSLNQFLQCFPKGVLVGESFPCM